MQNTASTYPLATGEIAAARLALIDCVCGTAGRDVMRSLGVLPGMRVADVGCGTGETTRWFASQVGQRGEVAAGYITAAELAQLAREFGNVAEDERVMVVHPLYAISWAQKPRSDRR